MYAITTTITALVAAGATPRVPVLAPPAASAVAVSTGPQIVGLNDSLPPSTAYIANSCPHNVYIRTCGYRYCTESTTLAPGRKYAVPYSPPNQQGTAIKIATDQSPAAPVLQFESATRYGRVWYDASAEDGNPFIDSGFTMAADDAACGRMDCTAAMQGACESMYKPGEDDGVHVSTGYPLSCSAASVSGLTLCTG